MSVGVIVLNSPHPLIIEGVYNSFNERVICFLHSYVMQGSSVSVLDV